MASPAIMYKRLKHNDKGTATEMPIVKKPRISGRPDYGNYGNPDNPGNPDISETLIMEIMEIMEIP